ncbi:hypothetical protein LCGC14_1631350, partial [marine sediment metagenome]
MISKPICRPIVNGFRFIWAQGNEEVLAIDLTKIIEQSRGALSAEFSIEHEFEERPTIKGIRFNLVSQQARSGLAKRLASSKIMPELEWPE